MAQTTNDVEPSVLIIGAGTFGTSTALHLSKTYRDPSRITIVDRWAPDDSHDKRVAAAIDSSRIIHTHYANEAYRKTVQEVMHTWSWTMGYLGHFQQTGLVVYDDRNTDKKCENPEEWWGVGVRGLEELGLETRGKQGEYDSKAGWVDAASATASFMRFAESRGVRRVTGEAEELVLNAERCNIEGVRLITGEVLKADKIVLAAGAWTTVLLAPVEHVLQTQEVGSIAQQITAVGRISAYYHLSEEATRKLVDAKTPIVVIPGVVEIIPPSLQNRTLKINDLRTEVVNTITTSSGRKISVPSARKQYEVPEDLQRKSEYVIRTALPGFLHDRRPDRWRMCHDAVTPTGDWIMCQYPDKRVGNLYVAVGGSFHSYKFLPIAGKYVVNILDGASNGAEKDESWGWKSAECIAKERREVREFEGGKQVERKSRL
ncbi:nucleotide-binding domain-containing protein [Dothidotthia symphoricarpi CBS 119687]|uniref:Nucleotide-binding domain-containing protein n=1 Tax=Dothidotthia symphoricarpi CBS 119687 TaxID=1392245 RepID=A0A6A6AF02_9PLEO|nr:nucleotide-binding domain-containing protein [Dothidotthia symphoricarpi CBS 119687]KAF2130542.1 nucleotide-binding domain-containing protein [Dothidotthia symphoricarpi CBS 119687]